MNGRETISIRYRFSGDAETVDYTILLDARTVDHVFPMPSNPPDWTLLANDQCACCPLSTDEHRYCPVALSLVELIGVSNRLLSFTQVDARVEMPDRTILKQTTAQKVLSYLLGLHMATSGCPHMQVLKPMARFHQPFAAREESMFRAVATYLMGQYFLRNRGKACDMDLTGLQEAYTRIHAVNMGMAKRLRHISKGDANINAIVLLDLLAQDLPTAIRERMNEIEYLFTRYFETQEGEEADQGSTTTV